MDLYIPLTKDEQELVFSLLTRFDVSDLGLSLSSKIMEFQESQESELAEKYRAAATNKDGELEVDGNAIVSFGDDPGAYVMAWQWVSEDDLED